MSVKRIGKNTISFSAPPSFCGFASVVGKKEGEGPMKNSFDYISEDATFGEKTWEKAESAMVQKTVGLALDKARLSPSEIDMIFAGDLLNQCIGTTFGLRSLGIPLLGLYGACSTMAESLILAAMSIDGGYADKAAAGASSHFCTAERQYRFPLEYGSVRPPSAQWTVTGCGVSILSSEGGGPFITKATIGKIVDTGLTDANNMGASMAPAAYDTISAFFRDTATGPEDYDLILTGDLGSIGSSIVTDFFEQDGINIAPYYRDCGVLMFSEEQDVHAGGSGCGCSASLLNGHILNGMLAGRWQRVLFAGTGSLQSPVSAQQGESLPAICHLVCIENSTGG